MIDAKININHGGFLWEEEMHINMSPFSISMDWRSIGRMQPTYVL